MLELGIPFDIALSPMEKVRFREECVSASPRLMRFAPKVDVLNSDASSSSDYKGIIEYLESRFCLQEVNSLIRNLLRTWLVRNIVEALQDYALSRRYPMQFLIFCNAQEKVVTRDAKTSL